MRRKFWSGWSRERTHPFIKESSSQHIPMMSSSESVHGWAFCVVAACFTQLMAPLKTCLMRKPMDTLLAASILRHGGANFFVLSNCQEQRTFPTDASNFLISNLHFT